MVDDALDIYCAAFIAPRRHEFGDPAVIVAPGIRAVEMIRRLVTDDSAYDRLTEEVRNTPRGVVMAFEQAPRCKEFLIRQGWREGDSQLAMVLPDIRNATGPSLPDGLQVRLWSPNIAREGGGVPLEQIARVAVVSDLSIKDSPDEVAGFITRLPTSVKLCVAVDDTGAARATAASRVFGEYAEVFFVNTEPEWRRRGIGQAMTVAALRAAADQGARSALLHATDFGISVYTRIGFETVGMVTRYQRPD